MGSGAPYSSLHLGGATQPFRLDRRDAGALAWPHTVVEESWRHMARRSGGCSRASCRWRGAAAVTFGHVVVGRDQWALASCRAQERVHVRQYECWGPFFIPAYVAASVWAILRRRDPYFDNPFEVEAACAGRS